MEGWSTQNKMNNIFWIVLQDQLSNDDMYDALLRKVTKQQDENIEE